MHIGCLFRLVYMSSVAGKQVMRVSELLQLEVQATGSLKMWELGDILRL